MSKNTRTSITLCILLAAAHMATAAEVPGKPIAKKGELLFSDDFDRTDLGKWKPVVPTFTVSDGVLKGSQTREDHGAVGRVQVDFKDMVAEFRIQLAGATSVNVVCDDQKFKGSHAGHICRVAITPRQIRLGDDKEGVMRNDIFEMRRDPKRKAEGDKLSADRGAAIPMKIESNRWYAFAVEIAGDQMRVSIDGKAIGYLKSPGLDHPTKTSIHFTVNGKDALVDDVRIWKAEPVK